MKILLILVSFLFPLTIFNQLEQLHLEPFDLILSSTVFRDCAFSTQILNIPFVINTPGLYCLGDINNINIALPTPGLLPSVNINVAITINVPLNQGGGDVILDLNEQPLDRLGRRLQIGILVQGQTNVIIRNGTLRNFVEGIRIDSSQRLCQEILIEDLFLIQNTTGIIANGGTNIKVRNCLITRSLNNGISWSNTNNSIFQNCICNNNGISTLGSGFLFSNTFLTSFIKCTANSNTVHGFNLQGTQATYLVECSANFNTGNGFFLITNAVNNSNNTLIECTAQNNQANGFSFNGDAQSVDSCYALANTLNGFIITAGFNHSILGSIAKINGQAGINLLPTTTACQIRDNTLTGNNIGLLNQGLSTSIYTNFANNNTTADFVGVPNFVTTPDPFLPINFTTNIAQ